MIVCLCACMQCMFKIQANMYVATGINILLGNPLSKGQLAKFPTILDSLFHQCGQYHKHLI